MAPVDQVLLEQQEELAPLRVHLTGFGPFKNIAHNPSWLAISSLHDTVLSYPLPSKRRKLHLTTQEVPVVYTTVLSVVPPLHASSKYDLLIHVGVGVPGAVKLEQRARRYGYEGKVDAAGVAAPVDDEGRSGFVGKEWDTPNCEEDVRTLVDCEKVVRSLKDRWNVLMTSEDAGLYLCEFITFCSTACARNKHAQDGSKPVPVQFVHVPPLGEPYSLSELTEIIKELVLEISLTLEPAS